jgi:hypothetical protein
MNEPISHDPVLQSKITSACTVIEQVLEKYERPAILCSFGKDSMLMLYMIRNWFRELPVIFFKMPHFQRKYAFAERMAADMELELHSNIPPIGISLTSKNGKTELVHHYGMGAKHLLRPIGRQNIEGKAKWLCAEQDLVKGPFGTYQWKWDLAFCGHKSSDSDPVQGDVPLFVDIHQIAGSCDLAFPLRHFTDEDVWRLTEVYGIPVNNLRYGKDRKSDPEGYFNDDYVAYCHRCLDPLEPDFVTCPKSGLQITNISSSFAQLDPKLAYSGG